MNQHGHNSDLIRDYLLGALAEAEAHRFEERYFEDESLFAEMQEIEDELIDDYASGALTAEQRTLFEKYFLDSSERREKLELARAMTTRAIAWKQEREAKQSATTVIGPAATTNADGTTSGMVLRFKTQGGMPSWFQWAAMAASVLFAVGAGALWFNNRELRRQVIAQAAKQEALKRDAESLQSERDAASKEALEAKAETLKANEEKQSLLDHLPEELYKSPFEIAFGIAYRMTGSKGEGEKKIKSVVLPASAARLRFSMAFPKRDPATFQALLRHSNQSLVGSPHVGLKATPFGGEQRVTFSVPARSLPAGDYELIVSGITPDGHTEGVGRYYLHVVRR
jgi:anti-sigma factor RsiW